jgi:Haem-NO-binding
MRIFESGDNTLAAVHGLINRAIQGFVRDTFGMAVWRRVALESELGFDSFEPMLIYDLGQTTAVMDAMGRILKRPTESLLEDLGTALVSDPENDVLRRLMRFGGVTFIDFLHSLEELQGRGRMAVPDLELPTLELDEVGQNQFRLTCRSDFPGAGHVLMGLLRAMADDYGALVLLDHVGVSDLSGGGEVIIIVLLDQNYAAGRRFDLAAPEG